MQIPLLRESGHFFSESHSTFTWVAINQLILSAGAAAIVISISYFLPESNFGSIRFLSSILAVLAFFSLPGINTLMVRDVESIGRKGVIQAIWAQVRWGLIASIAGVIIGTYYLFAGDSDLGYAFIIGGLLAPVANLYLLPGHLLAGLKKFRRKTVVDGVIIIATLLGATAGAFSTGTITGTIFFYFGTQATVTLLFLVHVIGQIPLSKSRVKADIEFGKQLTLFHVPFLLLPSVERILVFFFIGPIGLAIFVIATLPVEHTRNALRSLFQYYILPNLVKATITENFLYKWLQRALVITLTTMTVAAGAVLLCMPYVFPKYEEAYSLALVLLISLIPLPLYILPLSWVARKRVAPLLYYAYSGILLHVVLFIVFVPSYGIVGAVIAKIASEFLTALVLLVFHKQTEVTP